MTKVLWSVPHGQWPWSAQMDSLPQLSNKEDTVLGFRVHRMLQAEFLQAAQVTIYDYYEPCKPQDLGVERVSREKKRPAKDRARREG